MIPAYDRTNKTTEPQLLEEGLTVREYMATEILKGIVSCPNTMSINGKRIPDSKDVDAVYAAVQLADLLIEALKK
jgi:hypothetical protein